MGVMVHSESEHSAPGDDVGGWFWTRLRRAADDPDDPMRLVTLATVTPEGTPAARLMVLRGVERDPARVWFHTHASDAKVIDLSTQPAAQVVAYDASARAQLRISGLATVHRLDTIARMHFEQGSMLATRLASILGEGVLDEAKSSETANGASETERHSASESGPPDILWPTAGPKLIEATTRRAWREFAAIEISVGLVEIVIGLPGGSRRATLRAADGWRGGLT